MIQICQQILEVHHLTPRTNGWAAEAEAKYQPPAATFDAWETQSPETAAPAVDYSHLVVVVQLAMEHVK